MASSERLVGQEAQANNYSFAETNEHVGGRYFTVTQMREGQVIGRRVMVRYLGKFRQLGKEIYKMEICDLEGDVVSAQHQERMAKYKRYVYRQLESGLTFRIRASHRGQRAIAPNFQIDTEFKPTLSATKLGIQLPERPSSEPAP